MIGRVPGSMPVSGGGGGGSSYTPLAGGTSLYVDAAAGSDTTGDGTVGSPIATLDRAFEDIAYRRQVLLDTTRVVITLVESGDGVLGVDSPTTYTPSAIRDFDLVTIASDRSMLVEHEGTALIDADWSDDWTTYAHRGCFHVQVSGAPGWASGDLRGMMLYNVTTGNSFPIVEATGSDTLMVGAGHNGKATAPPCLTGHTLRIGKWRTKLDLSSLQPGKWGFFRGLSSNFQYLHIVRTVSKLLSWEGDVQWRECIIEDTGFRVSPGGRQMFSGSHWTMPPASNPLKLKIEGGEFAVSGSVIDGDDVVGGLVWQAGTFSIRAPTIMWKISALTGWSMLSRMTIGQDETVQANFPVILTLEDCPTIAVRGALMVPNEVKLYMRMEPGATDAFDPVGTGRIEAHVDSSYVQSDGTTPAGPPLGMASAPWAPELLEVPNDTVYQESRLPADERLAIAAVEVQVPTKGTTTGNYTLDVKLGGTSVLTGTVDLTGVTAGVWTAAALKTNGDQLHDGSSAQTLRVEATSDNADLTGYTDGILVSITLRRW